MRRLWLLFIVLLLVLTACGFKETADEKHVDETKKVEEDTRKETEKDSKVNQSTTESESRDEQVKEKTKEKDKTEQTEIKERTAWQRPSKIDHMNHLEIVHLAYDILEAQDQRDYQFLESIVSEGTRIDEKNNRFIFESVTYPYELDFFTKESLGDLEFRYSHEEEGVVTIGLAAMNKKEESSFVIDFQFIQEENKWKMKSMDVNK